MNRKRKKIYIDDSSWEKILETAVKMRNTSNEMTLREIWIQCVKIHRKKVTWGTFRRRFYKFLQATPSNTVEKQRNEVIEQTTDVTPILKEIEKISQDIENSKTIRNEVIEQKKELDNKIFDLEKIYRKLVEELGSVVWIET